MFTVQAVVTLVTAALGANLIGWKEPWLGQPPLFWIAVVLIGASAVLLFIGHYRWLDKIVKVVVVVLTLSTLSATLLVLPKVDWGSARLWPSPEVFENPLAIGFMVALVGWMPSAFDISIWHSLWTLARRRETKHAPSVRESMLDFNIGYFGTALLAFCFLTLGAGVMFGSGEVFAKSGGAFAQQVISLYTENLGEWSRPVITVAALTVMFSTTLTVVDGFPRAVACLVSRFREPEVPDVPTAISRYVYWGALVLLGVGSLVVIHIALGEKEEEGAFKDLVDLAITLSFLTTPALAWLNHRAIHGAEVPAEHRPGGGMRIYSWLGIAFSLAFVLWWLSTRA
jgi:Mn2+/Fe2+ NRAMP family transporter